MFDIGAEQIGEYLTTAQPQEDGAEEDAPRVIKSRWFYHNVQKLSSLYEPTPEDLILKDDEKKPEVSSSEGLENGEASQEETSKKIFKLYYFILFKSITSL